jgi:hypothetical protein
MNLKKMILRDTPGQDYVGFIESCRQSFKLPIQKRVSKKIVYIKVTYKYKTRKYIESRELKAKHNLSKICVTKEGGL